MRIRLTDEYEPDKDRKTKYTGKCKIYRMDLDDESYYMIPSGCESPEDFECIDKRNLFKR